MNSTQLNEHDANQGAQSSGEFLGMTGNSGWYLLGSGGMTIMMVIFLWGVLGVSLLLCLFVGLVLCLGSLVYVFTLKNNKPAHYDTDFFESALIEAGLLELRFGPRTERLANPFCASAVNPPARVLRAAAERSSVSAKSLKAKPKAQPKAEVLAAEEKAKQPVSRHEEQLAEKVDELETQLDEMLAEAASD